MKIGVAGLGRMGHAMAARLLEVRGEVTVWNRSAVRAGDLLAEGAVWAESPAALAEGCDVVVSILADDAAAREVYLGAAGLLAATPRRAMVVEMSTLSPEMVRALAAEAAARGVGFVESPVLGTVMPARTGQLAALTAGEAEAIARAGPVFEALTRTVIHVGEIGQAAVLKLCVNDMVIGYLALLGEATALGEAAGLSRDLVLSAIAECPAAAPLLKIKGDVLRGAGVPKVAASIATILKDMELLAGEAEARGLRLPLALGTRDSLRAARDSGWEERDMAELVAFHRGQAGG